MSVSSTANSPHLVVSQVRKLYISRAKQLEEMRQLKEAEKLYVIVGEPDFAISMYKKNKQVSSESYLSHNICLISKLRLKMFIPPMGGSFT